MSSGKNLSIRCCIAAFIILLSGCQSFQSIKTIETGHGVDIIGKNNRCSSGEVNANNILPRMLYENMNACITRGAWHDAVYLYALAGSSTWYDAVQVDTQFARSMHSRLLKESMDSLDNIQRNRFWQHIQDVMASADQKITLCQALIAAGAPTYRPDYMRLSPSRIVERNYPKAMNWERAVHSYVGCGR